MGHPINMGKRKESIEKDKKMENTTQSQRLWGKPHLNSLLRKSLWGKEVPKMILNEVGLLGLLGNEEEKKLETMKDWTFK